MAGNQPPSFVVDQMGDLVDTLVCEITKIKPGDVRRPPGDHHGTGWLVEKDGIPHLCTCEHVAVDQASATLGYSCFGGDRGVSVGTPFILYPHPLDFAIAPLTRSWAKVQHKGACVPKTQVASRHKPVDGEYLYVYGFPGADAYPGFEQHNSQGLGVFSHQVPYDPVLATEDPPADPQFHICVAWNPEHAEAMTKTSGTLSKPPGMSGSPLWNTRYKEVTESGGTWTARDARLTGIVWGASSKAGALIATPIEHIRHFLL